MPKCHPIAVAFSDLHLSLKRPACRDDKDWMETQASYLKQVKDVADGLPILCSGDVFDRWNPPPELINFALKHLSDDMICVPGQHDLPLHRIDLMHRSGYGVLVEAGKIKDISSGHVHVSDTFKVHGFGWEEPLKPVAEERSFLQMALIHRYCWTTNHSYPGAPEENHALAFKKQLKGYDVALFGDNHEGFMIETPKDLVIFNCGGFIRRKSDEIDYKPQVGIIYSDGSVMPHFLDTSIDQFQPDVEKRQEVPVNLKAFLDTLENLGEQALDFREAVMQHLSEVDEKTGQIILKSMEENANN